MVDLTIKADDAAKAVAGQFSSSYKARGYKAEALHTYTDATGKPRSSHSAGTALLPSFGLSATRAANMLTTKVT